MKIKRILWATDGSAEAEAALNYARYLAGLTKAEIIGVHVVPLPVELLFKELKEDEIRFHEWESRAEKNVADRFKAIGKTLDKAGIKFDGVILKGIPSERIREFSRLRKADLVVMGKQGHGLIESIMVGSETVKVLKNSRIPVLSVKGVGAKRKVDIKKILVPIDLSEDNVSALNYAFYLSTVTGAAVTVIYALRLDMYAQDMPAGALDIVIKQSVQELENRVRDLKQKFEKAGRKKITADVNTEVIHGLSPAISIAKYAAKKRSDLIVINTHGRAGIKRLILGSVTERLIPESPCSVLSLRP